MNRFIPLLSVLTLLAVSPLLGAWADAPRRLLHLSFEADQWVEFSASSSEIYSDYPHRAEGYKGDGASISRTGETGVITAIGNWKKELLDRVPEHFERKNAAKNKTEELERAQLERKVGRFAAVAFSANLTSCLAWSTTSFKVALLIYNLPLH